MRFAGLDITRQPSMPLADIYAQRIKGNDREAAAFTALRDAVNKPPWLKSFRKATHTEDEERGIDIVVETTDVGHLYIQVKSSVARARQTFQRHVDKPSADSERIIVIAVFSDENQAALGEKILRELTMRHFQLLKRLAPKT